MFLAYIRLKINHIGNMMLLLKKNEADFFFFGEEDWPELTSVANLSLFA